MKRSGKTGTAAAWALVFLAVSCWFPAVFPSSTNAQERLEEILDGFEDNGGTGTFPEPDTERALEGFESEPVPGLTEPGMHAAPAGPVTLDGYFKLGTTCNVSHSAPDRGKVDWRGLSRLRSEVMLEVKIRPEASWQARISGKGFYDAVYGIKGDEPFTRQVTDAYENELELREAYVLANPIDRLDIRFGRQIAVWGKSDNIRVTDILNPLDLREPGLTDIEDLRLPLTMTRLDYYWRDWRMTAIAVHEIRFDKTPVYGHDFFPASMPLPPEDTPSDGGDNTEFALAVSGIFSGWDMALYAAEIFDDTPHTAFASDGDMRQRHARVLMAGAAGNVAAGNFLLKAEAAFFDGLAFFNVPDREFSRIDALAGLEYSGFSETTISLEAVLRHITDFEKMLEKAPDSALENEFQTALRVERSFRNDTLKLTLLAATYGLTGGDGAFQRISLQYDITDALELTVGMVCYQDGDLPLFEKIGDNDRFYLEAKYNF